MLTLVGWHVQFLTTFFQWKNKFRIINIYKVNEQLKRYIDAYNKDFYFNYPKNNITTFYKNIKSQVIIIYFKKVCQKAVFTNFSFLVRVKVPSLDNKDESCWEKNLQMYKTVSLLDNLKIRSNLN